jgi:hypothetical protein
MDFELHAFVFILAYSRDREKNIVNILVSSPVSRKGARIESDDLH